TGTALVALLPLAPAILLYAALNAFSEEMAYRAPLLATLEPAVGGHSALWQSAVFFGVAHYFGIPGGLIGAVLSIFMGWMLSKAMLETRGLFWAWWIHFLSDVVIFSAVALALAP
ncbi:MAG: CPBP family intramembrane metalloprotease, partial [Actinomycetota bacterium]|nr:CPBP family intramembrane metalloprotease [Actinomycetota bacterium]